MTPEQKRVNEKADKAEDILCKAVAKWVKALGGRPVVVGGISVQKSPRDLLFNFSVAINVTGLKPILKHESTKIVASKKGGG